MTRKIAAVLLLMGVWALSGCYWEHDRGWYGYRDRDRYWDQDQYEHDDRNYPERTGPDHHDRKYRDRDYLERSDPDRRHHEIWR